MSDDTALPLSMRPGTSALGAALAAGASLAMGWGAASVHAPALAGHGGETLIAWVLLGLAGLGTLLCLHLALIWGLATLVLLTGPASRPGAALLRPLRVLAPRLARRAAAGAAVASAATALSLTSGLAGEGVPVEDPPPGTTGFSQTAQLLPSVAPAEGPSQGPERDPGAPGRDEAAGGRDTPLPSLGWAGATGAPTDSPTAGTAPPPGMPASDGAVPRDTEEAGGLDRAADPGRGVDPDPVPVRTLVVRPGDCLWSLTDELLGPGVDDPAAIAATWPVLHAANHDLIGADPDLLRPGQVLTVPPSLTTPQDTP